LDFWNFISAEAGKVRRKKYEGRKRLRLSYSALRDYGVMK
jgi:hypothetical protein